MGVVLKTCIVCGTPTRGPRCPTHGGDRSSMPTRQRATMARNTDADARCCFPSRWEGPARSAARLCALTSASTSTTRRRSTLTRTRSATGSSTRDATEAGGSSHDHRHMGARARSRIRPDTPLTRLGISLFVRVNHRAQLVGSEL